MVQGLDHPAGPSPGDAHPRHMLYSMNTSTDFQKKKKDGMRSWRGDFSVVVRAEDKEGVGGVGGVQVMSPV